MNKEQGLRPEPLPSLCCDRTVRVGRAGGLLSATLLPRTAQVSDLLVHSAFLPARDHLLGLGTPTPLALSFPPTLWPHVQPEGGLPTCLLCPTALTGSL